MTDRTRQLEFIRSFGNGRILDEAAQLVVVMGDDFFTDEQVKMICDRVAESERAKQHRMIENRKILNGDEND